MKRSNSKTNKKLISYKKGIWAETFAALYLRLKGYKILKNRFKVPVGEIDLIALKSEYLVCVEVKYRTNQESALEAVNTKTQKRIIAAAHMYLAQYPKYNGKNIRFDVITVSTFFKIRHHKNAWYDS